MKKILSALLYLFFCSGCTYSILSTKKDAAFDEKMYDLLVVYKSTGARDTLGYVVGRSLKKRLGKKGIPVNVLIYEALELNSEEQWQKEFAGQTRQLRLEIGWGGPLNLRLGDPENAFNSDLQSASLDLRLFKKDQPVPVWRGALAIESINEIRKNPSGGRRIAALIVENFQKDGLLLGTKKNNRPFSSF